MRACSILHNLNSTFLPAGGIYLGGGPGQLASSWHFVFRNPSIWCPPIHELKLRQPFEREDLFEETYRLQREMLDRFENVLRECNDVRHRNLWGWTSAARKCIYLHTIWLRPQVSQPLWTILKRYPFWVQSVIYSSWEGVTLTEAPKSGTLQFDVRNRSTWLLDT